MGRNEEGGVLTQKLNVAILAILLVLTAGMAAALVADDSSAAGTGSGSVELESYSIGQEKSTTATLKFNDTAENFNKVSWTAKLVNSSGTTPSGASVSPSTGSSTDANASWTATVKAPTTAGDYSLIVTYTEEFSGGSEKQTYEAKTTLHVLSPITLSVTVSNTGSLAINNAKVYFYVDGVKVDDSEQNLSVAAGSSATVTYKYYSANLSHGEHTYYLSAGDSSYNLNGLGDKQTFYYEQGNMDYMNWIMILIIVILVIIGIWVYRKPVKNYGKPKARR